MSISRTQVYSRTVQSNSTVEQYSRTVQSNSTVEQYSQIGQSLSYRAEVSGASGRGVLRQNLELLRYLHTYYLWGIQTDRATDNKIYNDRQTSIVYDEHVLYPSLVNTVV